MVSRKPILTLVLITALLLGAVGSASAHGWQTTVTQGDMELGVSSSPEEPIAGMKTEFTARIKDANPEGDADRLDWGGVTNRTAEVHIRGPDGYHDHVKVEIPKDEAHFHWTYRFPTDGNYSIAVVSKIEGQEYAFQFQRSVSLLPAKASGEEIDHLSEEVHAISEDANETNRQVKHLSEEVHGVSEDVKATNEEVKHVHEKVESLQSQMDDVSSSVASLEQQQAADSHQAQTSPKAQGLGIAAGLAVVTGIVAFIAGKQT